MNTDMLRVYMNAGKGECKNMYSTGAVQPVDDTSDLPSDLCHVISASRDANGIVEYVVARKLKTSIEKDYELKFETKQSWIWVRRGKLIKIKIKLLPKKE